MGKGTRTVQHSKRWFGLCFGLSKHFFEQPILTNLHVSYIDPQQWSELEVSRWLNWAIKEFNLEGVDVRNFSMHGKEICCMDKDMFLARAPHFMGDILWEHLERLLKGVFIKKSVDYHYHGCN